MTIHTNSMTNDEFMTNTEQMRLAFDSKYRGLFLVQTAGVEALINDIIARIFYPNTQNERDFFISIMLYDTHLSFQNKINILLKLLKLKYCEFFEDNENLKKYLTDIREFRNLLAHSHLTYLDKNYNESEKNLVKYNTYHNGKQELRSISESDFKEHIRISGKVTEILMKFHALIKKD